MITSVKDRAVETIRKMSDEVSTNDIVERLRFIEAIEQSAA